MCIYIYVWILPIYKNAFDIIYFFGNPEENDSKILGCVNERYVQENIWFKFPRRIHGVVAIYTNLLKLFTNCIYCHLYNVFSSKLKYWITLHWISVYYSEVNAAQTFLSSMECASVGIILFFRSKQNIFIAPGTFNCKSL